MRLYCITGHNTCTCTKNAQRTKFVFHKTNHSQMAVWRVYHKIMVSMCGIAIQWMDDTF